MPGSKKIKGGGCYDKVISGDPNISAEGRETIQSLIVWVKKLVFHLIPPVTTPAEGLYFSVWACSSRFLHIEVLIRFSKKSAHGHFLRNAMPMAK